MNLGTHKHSDHSSRSPPQVSHPSPGTSGQSRLMSATILLTEASHMAKLPVKGLPTFYPWQERLQSCIAKGMDYIQKEMKNQRQYHSYHSASRRSQLNSTSQCCIYRQNFWLQSGSQLPVLQLCMQHACLCPGRWMLRLSCRLSPTRQQIWCWLFLALLPLEYQNHFQKK